MGLNLLLGVSEERQRVLDEVWSAESTKESWTRREARDVSDSARLKAVEDRNKYGLRGFLFGMAAGAYAAFELLMFFHG